MTSTDNKHPHPAAGTLARLAEGTLPRTELPQVLAHLEDCSDCMEALATANDVLAMEGKHASTGAPVTFRQRRV